MTAAIHRLQAQRTRWQLACAALTLLAVLLASGVISAAANVQIKLKPLSVASSAPLSLNSFETKEFQGTVEDQLSRLALSDLYLIVNYTPESVVAQTQRFLARLTPGTYEQRASELLVKANTARQANFSQRFDLIEVKDGISVAFPSPPATTYTVKLAGNLIRLRDGLVPIRVPVTYALTYERAPSGTFFVDSIRTLSK